MDEPQSLWRMEYQ